MATFTELQEAAENPAARQLRRDLVRELADEAANAGDLLRVTGHLLGSGRVDGSSPFGNGDDGLVALGYTATTLASLLRGIELLVRASQYYPAAALIRQLVEVE